MANVKNQAWLKGSWVCGKRIIPNSYSAMFGYASMHCIGRQVRYATSPLEHAAVAVTDKIIGNIMDV